MDATTTITVTFVLGFLAGGTFAALACCAVFLARQTDDDVAAYIASRRQRAKDGAA